MTTMTTKEMFELSREIYSRLNDYRHDIASAIIVIMNERGVKEIDLKKTREDCKKKGLTDVAECFEYIANGNIVDIYNYNEEKTLECYIDRVIIGDLGFVGCVCSGVQDPDFEITENVRTLNIQTAISVMELVAEYFDFMDEIASKK